MYSAFNPIAVNTCDGSLCPEVHAEPLEAHIPKLSNSNNNCSPFMFLKDTFAFPGNLFSLLQFIFTLGIFFVISSK